LKGVVPAAAQHEAASAPTQIGRYQVLGLIGRGAMGVVYKARDPLLDRIVAVKTINPPAALGERVRKAFLERFEREAKAAAGISHPAIVTIFDVGLDLANPFLVMEYLPGETLADRLDRGRVPLPQVFECGREIASALAKAHRARIVHRDVKPANVLDAGDGRWKLADFGIARLPDSDLTQHGTFMGTPGYSPPEAIREGRYTAQADVFGWGALFYELLSGRIPYEGPDTETTNKRVIAAEPPSPLEHDPSLPPALAAVAMRALAHDVRARYVDGTALAQALIEAWQESLRAGLVPVAAFASAAAVDVNSVPPAPPARVAPARAAVAPAPVAPAPAPAPVAPAPAPVAPAPAPPVARAPAPAPVAPAPAAPAPVAAAPTPAAPAAPAPTPAASAPARRVRELATEVDAVPRGTRTDAPVAPPRRPEVRPLRSSAREEVQVIRTTSERPVRRRSASSMSRATALTIVTVTAALLVAFVIWLAR
jgi:serine/threonine-protein kinase